MTPCEEFTARLMRLYWDHECADIDGSDIDDLGRKCSLLYDRPVTQKEITQSAAMREYDLKPGDNWTFGTPELLALMKELK